jgi:hypothetical protein
MSKQLILITADFNCGHCTRARKEVPTICETNGWEYTEMKNEKTSKPEDRLPVDLYPTIMLRVDGKMSEVVKGFNPGKLTEILKKY